MIGVVFVPYLCSSTVTILFKNSKGFQQYKYLEHLRL